MLLWMSSGQLKIVCCDELVELAGDVAFEASNDFFLGHAFFGASLHVVAGAGVPAQAAEYDAVERGVGLPVAAAVEPVPGCLAGAGGDRGDAAEHGERGFGGESAVVLSGADQQLPGRVGADAIGGQQARVDGGHEWFEEFVEVGDLGGQLLVAAG